MEKIGRIIFVYVFLIVGNFAYVFSIDELIYDKISNGEIVSAEFWPAIDCIEKPAILDSDVFGFFVKLSPALSINNITHEDEALPQVIPLFDMYKWAELRPFEQFGITVNIGGFELLIDMDLKVEPSNYLTKHGGINIPIPQGALYNLPLDMNFPRCGYMRYSNESFFIQLGRTKLKWGPCEFPITISDSSPYFDNFSFSQKIDFAKNGSFTYSYNLISIDPNLTPTESSLQARNVFNGIAFNEPSKTLVAHRLDLKFFKNFRVGIGELNLVGGKQPDLQDMNPFIILHNIYSPHYQNVIGSLDFSWTIIPNFMIYGELAFDDIRLPSEPKDSPLEYGLSLGSRFTSRIFDGKFMGSVEYSRTSNWMYNCRKQPYLKFTNRIVTISNFPYGINFFDYPIGFKYGQGADMFSATLDYSGDVLDLAGQLLLLRKGQFSFEDYYNNEAKNAFTNHVIFNFSGVVQDLFFKNLNFFVDLYLHLNKDAKVDLSFGFEYSLVLKDITELFGYFVDRR